MPSSIPELKEKIETAILAFNWPSAPAKVYEPQDYILRLGGKRMRPVACLLACDMYKGDLNLALNPALAIEFFHNFSLIHDDIMDEAPLRRGAPTVHHKWDLNVGLLSGDAMLIKAFQLLEELEPALYKKVSKLFTATALGVCDGQQLDMDLAERTEVSLVEYIDMISLKTAVLLGFSFEMGALIAGASDEEASALYQMGMDLGVGFQIQDDLLDAYADPEKFGKQVGGDIAANKQSFLLVSALSMSNADQKNALLHQLSFGAGKEKIDTVMEIYNELKLAEIARNAADEYFTKAINALESLNVEAERKQPIKGLIQQLWVREA